MEKWNIAIFNFIHNWSGRSVFADVAGIVFAEYLPYLLVLGFLVLVFREPGARRKFYLFAEGVLAVILARGIISESIYFFFHTVRPYAFFGFAPLIGESGSSFPSGHMAWFFALALAVWFADRKWGWWYLALSFIMGIARIYVGVHWPFDILGGIVIGLASALFVHWMLRGARRAIFAAPDAAGHAGT